MKQRQQIKLIAKAAKAAGFSVQKLGSTGETMLGDVIHVSNKKAFWLVSTRKIGFFPNTSVWFKMLCNSKETSSKFLKTLGYNTVTSVYFSAQHFAKPAYFQKMSKRVKNYPIVCKPENGLRGRNIVVANDHKQLKQYYTGAKKVGQSFLTQPIITGNEYRIAVFENVVFAMHNKEYFVITGNGKDSIAKLCRNSQNPIDKSYLKYQLSERKITTRTVLAVGETIPVHIAKKDGTDFLRKTEIPKPIRDWALLLCKETGCSTVGIDVIIPDDITQVSKYKIFEINASPAFSYLEKRYDCSDLVDEIASHIVKQSFN